MFRVVTIVVRITQISAELFISIFHRQLQMTKIYPYLLK